MDGMDKQGSSACPITIKARILIHPSIPLRRRFRDNLLSPLAVRRKKELSQIKPVFPLPQGVKLRNIADSALIIASIFLYPL